MHKFINLFFITICSTLSISAVAEDSTLTKSADWPLYHRTSEAWRHSPLNDINKTNVNKLKVAWTHTPAESSNGLMTTPIVIDGVIYYSDSKNNVYALDGKTGKELWRYQTKLDSNHSRGWHGPGSRGVTVGRGKVFIGTLDGRFIAIDQSTGKEIWSIQLINQPNDYYSIFLSPPQLAKNVIFGGSTGGDLPRQGKIYGVDADSGKLIWTFNTIKENTSSWPKESGKYGGGGAWMPGIYDEKSDTIFVGTSNPAPDFFPQGRRGDNLYTSSIVALDPTTGTLKWHRQEIPNDAWDFDAMNEIVTLRYKDREVLMHLNKGGFSFVLDKTTGELVNVWRLNDHINWVKNIDPKSGELIGRVDPEVGKKMVFCPGVHGGRTWAHGAYNPELNLWFTTTVEICTEVVAADIDPKKIPSKGLHFGVSFAKNVGTPDGPAYGRLVAVDPVTGERRWSLKFATPHLSSILSTAGGLIFNGDTQGNFAAYDAESGSSLWEYNTGYGSRGSPVSYKADGQQFILTPVGMGYTQNSQTVDFMTNLFPDLRRGKKGGQLIAFKIAD
jgi:alcohol dehydrogenase (cytochrome c)